MTCKKPPLEIRLQVLSTVDYAPGNSIRARIQSVATRTFVDKRTNIAYQFTWRTISTWLYRFKKNGVTTLDNKTRRDKNQYRKVQPNELAEAINDVLPTLGRSKNGGIPKMALYRRLLSSGLVKRSQLTWFNPHFTSLDELNEKTTHWIEHDYNSQFHSGIQMTPLDRFTLDLNRVQFIADDEYTEEVFFVEQDRKVSKTNVFSINKQQFECPVDLRGKTIQVRFNRASQDKFIVYYQEQRMGQATRLDLQANAHRHLRGDA